MIRRQRTPLDKPNNEPITPLARSASSNESELDQYINLGEKPQEDVFADILEE